MKEEQLRELSNSEKLTVINLVSKLENGVTIDCFDIAALLFMKAQAAVKEMNESLNEAEAAYLIGVIDNSLESAKMIAETGLQEKSAKEDKEKRNEYKSLIKEVKDFAEMAGLNDPTVDKVYS